MKQEGPKPAGSKWTDEQWAAISLRGDNILVAAAAGSGKTAVLVERIIRRISSTSDPLDVDRLLVATFTNAAAAEMRQRIREALENALSKDPHSVHLRRQLALVHQASITTLHSFCLEVIRRYYQLVPLDPGFRIANETEADLLRQDVLEEMFEEYYGASGEDSAYWRLLDGYGGERGDTALQTLVQRLYDFSRSHPSPDQWLRRMAESFHEQGDKLPWLDSLQEDVLLELQGSSALLREALRLARLPDGPAPYVDSLHADLALVEHLLELGEQFVWEPLYQAFQTAEFGKLKPCRGEQYGKDLQEQVKELRERAKKQVGALRNGLFLRPLQEYIQEHQQLYPLMSTLAELVTDFGRRYRSAKTDKGLVDFADLEHYCLQVLRESSADSTELRPSQAALEYREHFAEVLLDEYQDTNMVQEAIITLISKTDQGNRFMVGDVKQSIYRFRLAEPGLFLQKYKTYRLQQSADRLQTDDRLPANPTLDTVSAEGGLRIDLARNFRSRREIVDGVNFIFRQIMHETAAEIEYDARAELVYGANYAETDGMDLSVEWMLVDRSKADEPLDGGSAYPAADSWEEDAEGTGETDQETAEGPVLEAHEMETAALEARLVAAQIRKLMGTEGNSGIPGNPMRITDKKTGSLRPVAYRDIVILLRASQQWAPIFLEQFRQAGIPAYADLNTGYFTAMEIEVFLSLLKIIDNPYQDIALAAVLRSPIVGLSAEDLALIRIQDKQAAYFDAVRAFVQTSDRYPEENNLLKAKIVHFLSRLDEWRSLARQGSLADLIWRLYRETGYFDYVGGLAGGGQRQANLRALYDRARQYEATTLRGLFRFLRFIERMQANGGDLGTARALGEQEDVVRLISIHKSKGLEFPVVFIAGMGKMFNQRDVNGSFLLHKELGFGPKFVDPDLRASYPSLANLAIKRRVLMENLAEEMRILYVALTRPKEKMYLVGTVKNLEKQVRLWGQQLENKEWRLPAHILVKARSYLDWLGPALIRHPELQSLRAIGELPNKIPPALQGDRSSWKLTIVPQRDLAVMDQAAAGHHGEVDPRIEALRNLKPVNLPLQGPKPMDHQGEADRRLGWSYLFPQATAYLSKTSVSELKRIQERERGQDDLFLSSSAPLRAVLSDRPKFMQQKSMTAAERGTLYHAVMQYITLDPSIDDKVIAQTLARMVQVQLITPEQRQAVDAAVIETFFKSALGQRMLQSRKVQREVPFSYGLKAADIYPGVDQRTAQETVLIQGVIDCLFAEEDGLVLVDYKTDHVGKSNLEQCAEKYKLQIHLYAKAIESILQQPVKEKYLFFFDGAHTVRMPF